MPMFKRGYGAVRNPRCKIGARFPPCPVGILLKTFSGGEFGKGIWILF